RIMTAGLNFKVLVLENVVEKITLKQQTFSFSDRYLTQDKVTVEVSINIIYRVMPDENSVKKYTYVLMDRVQTIEATIENAFRASISQETHEDVMTKKEVLTRDVWEDLKGQFADWGIEIVSLQIVSVRLVSSY